MKNKNFLKLIIALVVSQLFAIIGSLLTVTSSGSWFSLILKPSFTPPGWMFGSIWTILYLLMGLSAFLIWRQKLERKEVRFALLIFVFQLCLNLFWVFIFFSLKNPAIAFTEIISLLFAILATGLAFYQISKPAAYLLIPYVLWIMFLAVFNYSVWTLNPGSVNAVPAIDQESSLVGDVDEDYVINDDTLMELNFEE